MAYSDYAQEFQGAAKQYGVDPNLLSSVAWQESRYNPQAVGSAGEQGMMQFMPATAKGMGLSNPFDPHAAIYAGANLLHQNLQASGGDPSKALMMYNGGTNPAHWNPDYAKSVLGHAQQLGYQPSPNPYQQQPQPGGQPQMPPQQPPASLGQMAGPNIGADPNAASLQYQGPSLASLATMPNVKQPSKFTAGNILGTLGDALSAYGGKAPTFGPFLREQQMMQQQQNFEREKFNQELQMRMMAMMNPPDVMDAKVIGALPPAQQRQYLRVQDMKNPLWTTVNGSQVLQKRVQDPTPDAVSELKRAVSSGDHSAILEFDHTFGPGASAEALGGN